MERYVDLIESKVSDFAAKQLAIFFLRRYNNKRPDEVWTKVREWLLDYDVDNEGVTDMVACEVDKITL